MSLLGDRSYHTQVRKVQVHYIIITIILLRLASNKWCLPHSTLKAGFSGGYPAMGEGRLLPECYGSTDCTPKWKVDDNGICVVVDAHNMPK